VRAHNGVHNTDKCNHFEAAVRVASQLYYMTMKDFVDSPDIIVLALAFVASNQSVAASFVRFVLSQQD